MASIHHGAIPYSSISWLSLVPCSLLAMSVASMAAACGESAAAPDAAVDGDVASLDAFRGAEAEDAEVDVDAGRDPIVPVPPAPEDDAEIVALINALPAGEAMRLPDVSVNGGGDSDWFRNGPDQRNFCNRMAYSPERQTALYAGGNHGAPHVMADVWEYHLGSNTWQNLYGPVGGNHARWNNVVGLISGNFGGTGAPAPEDVDAVERFKTWWMTYVDLTDGYLHDSVGGGPLYPRHTWDTLVYDPVRRRLVWPVQASGWMFRATVHQYVHGLSETPVVDSETVSRMWLFDPATGTWEAYRNPAGQSPPTFRAVAASMLHVGESRFVYFNSSSAGRGETPGMFSWDSTTDTWTDMRPNDGRSYRSLYTGGDAPRNDSLAAYSPTHDVVLAVGAGRYVGPEPIAQLYRFSDNTWSATSPPPFRADDATSNLVYAPTIERFVLLQPKESFNADVFLFDPMTETWERRPIVGPALSVDRPAMAYYDPRFGVIALQQKRSARVWVYRP